MLPKFHVVLASAVRFISTHCTAIVSFVLMNGPVKMFVAEALDEMMAGWLADDASEPLYVNVLAPDSDKAVADADGVIDPVIDIIAADEHTIPIDVPDPPVTFPLIVINVPLKLIPY